MQFQIEVLAVTSTTKPTAKGSYTQLDVAYKKEGKTEGKKIMSFGAGKKAFDVLKNAKTGEVYTISSSKNEQSGYWDWTDAVAGAAGDTSTKAAGYSPSSSPRNTYETPEERAQKQVYIVRQSSIASAIELLKTDKKQPDVNEVLQLAQQFEAFVFSVQADTPPKFNLGELEDDVPL